MGCFTSSAANSIREIFGTRFPRKFGAATNTDLFIGRNAFGILAAMNLEEITVSYVVVDTLRVPRETFATILEAWRDGYSDTIGEVTAITRELSVAYFDQNDCQYPRPARVRRMDGSRRECACATRCPTP